MFKSINLLINVIIVISLLQVLRKLVQSFITKMPDLEWTYPMLILLGMAFILEVWRWRLGYKIMWQYFNFRDRIVFFIALTEVMLLLGIIEKSQTPWIIDLLLGITGLFLGWSTIRLFGSSAMEKAIRMPLPLLQRNPNEDISH